MRIIFAFLACSPDNAAAGQGGGVGADAEGAGARGVRPLRARPRPLQRGAVRCADGCGHG